MSRRDLDTNFSRIGTLVSEIEQFAPAKNLKSIEFRGDLAGLLVVLIVATYENCVKNSIVSYANNHHAKFGNFTQNHFKKLNSRIAIQDLYLYTKTFDQSVHRRFKETLNHYKERILRNTGQDVEEQYKLLLDWRHNFAHTGNKSTTVEEAIKTHRFAKYVLYSFDDAFTP